MSQRKYEPNRDRIQLKVMVSKSFRQRLEDFKTENDTTLIDIVHAALEQYLSAG